MMEASCFCRSDKLWSVRIFVDDWRITILHLYCALRSIDRDSKADVAMKQA